MRVTLRIRKDPWYRRVAFEAGLEKVGFGITDNIGVPKSRDDVLCLWNRMAQDQYDADAWEAKGGTVFIAENGYAGRDTEGRQLYAISVHGHCGAGWYPVGDEDRFSQLGIELQPWRNEPGYILIAGQRGLGSRTMASPPRWEDKMFERLKDMGHKNLKVRRHPGREKPKTSIVDDLKGASACVVWSSSCGVVALTMGVPVVYFAPTWICREAAPQGPAALSLNRMPLTCTDEARLKALHTMSHGQWRVEEIESGEPFKRILEHRAEAKW